MLDSKPFTYFTIRSTVTFWRADFTWELTPVPDTDQTHLQIRVRPEQRLRTTLATPLVTRRLRRMLGGDLANLVRLLQDI